LTVKRRETGKGLQSTFGCPKTLRGVDGNRPFKIGSFSAKIATTPLSCFQGAQNGLGRLQV
jgi:hypothetical protein